jgi:hypothetical protein
MPAEALERVKEMAEEIATPPSVLIRQWSMEHTRRAPRKGAAMDARAVGQQPVYH